MSDTDEQGRVDADADAPEPATARARAFYKTNDEVCRLAVAARPAGIDAAFEARVVAIARGEIRSLVLPLVRAALDATDDVEEAIAEIEDDTREAFDEVREIVDGQERRVAQGLAMAVHDNAAGAIADYMRIHYPEDDQARVLADRLTTSMRVLAAQLVAAPVEDTAAGESAETVPARESAGVVVPIRPADGASA